MMAAPIKQTPLPTTSDDRGAVCSMMMSQASEPTMYTPPYAAKARPAKAESTFVSTAAKTIKMSVPGTSHQAVRPRRSHIQTA